METKNKPIYAIDYEKAKYPSCLYSDGFHELLGILSPSLIGAMWHGEFGNDVVLQYRAAQAEHIKIKVNNRSCTRYEWMALKAYLNGPHDTLMPLELTHRIAAFAYAVGQAAIDVSAAVASVLRALSKQESAGDTDESG